MMINTIKSKLISVISTLVVVCLMAIPINATSYELITDIGTSAKMIGIGNIEGFDTSAAAIFENPASTGHIDTASVSAFYTSFLDGDVNFMAYSAGVRTHWGVVSIGLMTTGTPESHITSSTGDGVLDQFQSDGTFKYENSVLKLGYQMDLNYWTYIGVAANYFSHKIHEVDGNVLDADIGLYTKIEDVELSLVAKHVLGTEINYSDDTQESAPRQYVVAAKTVSPWLDDLELFGQYRYADREGASLFAVGASWVPFGYDMMAVSAGWQQYLVLSDVKSKVSIGVILDLDTVSFNFAFEESGFFNQDYQYYFSTDVNF